MERLGEIFATLAISKKKEERRKKKGAQAFMVKAWHFDHEQTFYLCNRNFRHSAVDPLFLNFRYELIL